MNKYRNVKVELDGYKFDSKAEAQRYTELKLMQSQGLIEQLRVHPRYELWARSAINPGAGQKVCTYVADFEYVHKINGRWRRVTEDVKGVRTAVFNLKMKLMKVLLDVDVVLIGRKKGVKHKKGRR